MSVRYPIVAGTFYSSDTKRLRKEIESCFLGKYGPGKLPGFECKERSIIALVAPHAGYIYSGQTAAWSYSALSEEKSPETVIILNDKLAQEIFSASKIINFDELAHVNEHSIEVHVPFLQYLYGDKIKIVPIVMGYQDLETSQSIGKTLAEVLRDRNMVILASTDLTHQEPKQLAKRKDDLILDSIRAMDEVKLQNVVKSNRITMCGYGPVSAALVAAKLLGANRAEVLSYNTSGDITGDLHAVVGYAAAKITKTVQ
ncbi:MAG: AmmeMemoRadiSam system protein B [Candidatus Bathyarchaeota archaeon]|nr:AmmeMemoRadiSam system protein B [Candidatus Bathyarchaeota archaeon]